jgi:uncharacterized membrane protein YagU involved in acid resistance
LINNTDRSLLRSVVTGAAAGVLAGGTIAILIQASETVMFFAAQSPLGTSFILILSGAGLGAGFGLLIHRQRPGAGENLFWGMSYGIFWWVLGQLTLIPWVLNGSFTWDLTTAQSSFPELIGFLVFGSLTGLFHALIRLRSHAISYPAAGTLVRGVLAGLASAWVLGSLLDAQGHLVPMGAMMPDLFGDRLALAAWIIILAIGAIAGAIYAGFYPRPVDGAGVAMTRGAAYGFFSWSLGALTLLPLLTGQGVGWSLGHVRTEFPTLPGFIIFGSILTLIYQWLYRSAQLLLSEDIATPHLEGPGFHVIRALGRGAVAGLVGGGLFTLIMFQVGYLPAVANLIGSSSTRAGLLVHFVIAIAIGMTYGLLFRRQSFHLTSAMGWGLTYGFMWWILGAQTLMPVMLGSHPQWDVSAVSVAFPALVGHFAYGLGLGLVFHVLEARDRPWWISRGDSEAQRIRQRKEQILSSAPAIWVLIVMIALILPVLLGM